MTVAAPRLDPAICSWMARAAEIAETSGEGLDERSRARMLSDTLFAEFGSEASGATRTTHWVDSPTGRLRVDEYRPAGATEVLPACLVLHGGAFRLGDLDELVNVAFCGARAVEARYAVFCPEYSLAPQRPHPAASLDARATLSWLGEQAPSLRVDADRVVVAGVSAGGALAAALAMWARDAGLSVRGLLLEVPVVDLSDSASWITEYAELNGLPSVDDLRTGYVTDVDAASPEVSPLLGDLSGLPPTHVMTAEFDPLRASGESFITRLREAGNLVTGTRHFGGLHGSQSLLRNYRGARLWHREVVSVLRDLADHDGLTAAEPARSCHAPGT